MVRWRIVGGRSAVIGLVSLTLTSHPLLALAAPAAPWTDTVVSPRKTAESRLNTTRAVTVITREDIERWGSAFVADALRHVPGVYVRRAGGIGRVTNAVIRGSSAAHVLVMVDDVQVNAASLVTRSIDQPGVYSSSLPVEEVGRWRRNAARLRHLDEWAQRLKQLEQKVHKLTEEKPR